MRVLAVDPGLTRCGVGVVDGLPGRRALLVEVAVVRTPVDAPLAERLLAVSEALELAVARHRPDAVAVERVFSRHDVSTVMGTAQASGVALLAAARAGVPVGLHTPSEVKAAVTGSGRAGKAQVTAMVTRILGLDEAPRPADAADALALALCHLWRGAPAGGAAASSGAAGGGGAGGGRATAAQAAWAEADRAARAVRPGAWGAAAGKAPGGTARRGGRVRPGAAPGR
ncbi:crossover junction endodeoxyribonuclease RuvC [uncultured Pseudokineococcus sp.]|uniref:crossover junction endodeoxyribonuclease RuvC n=1 Tax=uncultured Pseudokineococcus sp. TaxID=1642928 RepID=UPI002633A68A|nr:crossover junction endodeoxyribonuclease RuvC [uncultured Pseudokineococcus sp.]